jgi:hypothetical protein
MSDGRKDSCKMSERDKKKKKCDYCQVPNFTKYDGQTCDGEFCSDCTNLKPADCKVILSYCGHWECKACRELPEEQEFEDKPAMGATGEQGKEELIYQVGVNGTEARGQDGGDVEQDAQGGEVHSTGYHICNGCSPKCGSGRDGEVHQL